MSSAHTLITMGALMILTFAVFNMNRMLGETDITLAQERYKLEALSIMTSHVEWATRYLFDETSRDSLSHGKAEFTDPNDLGHETSDSDTINDFDDYNEKKIIDIGRSGVAYEITFNVDYVTLSGAKFIKSNNREYHKRMQLSISDTLNPPLIYKYKNSVKTRDTLRLSYIRSYWYYN